MNKQPFVGPSQTPPPAYALIPHEQSLLHSGPIVHLPLCKCFRLPKLLVNQAAFLYQLFQHAAH